MATTMRSTFACRIPERFPAWSEPEWYAAHTCANHEKRVAEQLHARAVEHFLPLYSAMHRWKDRRVQLELPLFPGYVFVRLPLSERLRVLRVPGVVDLVGFGGRPAPLPEREIAALRDGLCRGIRARPHPFLTAGRRVRIANGPLAGVEGILLREKSSFRVVLSIDLVMRSILLEVDAADLEPLTTLHQPATASIGIRPSS